MPQRPLMILIWKIFGHKKVIRLILKSSFWYNFKLPTTNLLTLIKENFRDSDGQEISQNQYKINVNIQNQKFKVFNNSS